MLGIWPLWHGLQWLPKLIGPAAALDMILTGRAVDARRAKRMGPRHGGCAAAHS
jgi:3-hydroxyacyl-CoA dehydrogenase/enoyl-CoA hydratase/3-hydroxybutyryl-CoA epimerase